jgi:hypothetical protein
MSDDDTYPGSVHERLDKMIEDLKVLAWACMKDNSYKPAQLCLAAIEIVDDVVGEMSPIGFDDAQWTDVQKMVPSENGTL